MSLPEKFKCVVTNWKYLEGLCIKVYDEVYKSGFKPDTIVALARGGWFPGRLLCDLHGISDLMSLKIEHYLGTALTSDRPLIRYPILKAGIAGKKVLIVDDIADTGKSLIYAEEHIKEAEPDEVKSCTIQVLATSEKMPDHYGEFIELWAWIIYPWNFVEDMTNLIGRMFKDNPDDSWALSDIKLELYKRYEIDPIYLEIAQPNRLPEVMKSMERNGIIKIADENSWIYEGAVNE